MFNKEKYMTRGVDTEIPFKAQLTMWHLIEVARPKVQLDYLQIFKLKPAKLDSGLVQVIEHSQEQPKYHQVTAFACDNPIDAKVWVIDDGTHCTMLLPEER